MIDQTTIELIHASVDGELDTAQQDALGRALGASEEARHYQAELLKFCGLLEEQVPAELPQGLHRKIVDSITLPAHHAARGGFAALPGFFRYGLAAAAGVLLTVGLMESQSVSFDSRDLDKMVGTIMQSNGAAEPVILDRFSFDLDEVSSSVSLQQRDKTLVLDVILNSEHPVDITVDFTGVGLVFDAIAQIQSELKSIGVADRSIQISGKGKQHFAVLLHRESGPVGQSEASFRLGFARNGQLVKEGTLVTK